MTTRPCKSAEEGVLKRCVPLPLTGFMLSSPEWEAAGGQDRVCRAGSAAEATRPTLRKYTRHASIPALKLPAQRWTAERVILSHGMADGNNQLSST